MRIRICVETSKGYHEGYLEIKNGTCVKDIPRIIENRTGITVQEEDWEVCDEIS